MQRHGGAGVLSTAQSYGQGSNAMGGILQQEGLSMAKNRADVANQYYTQSNKTIPAGVLGMQPNVLSSSQSHQVLPRPMQRNTMLPPLNPASAAPGQQSYTPQNDGAPRNFNFSALPPVTVGQQALAAQGQQPQARTLSRAGGARG